jgi:hypothetical protein
MADIRPGLDRLELAVRQRPKAPQSPRCPAARLPDTYWQIGYSVLNSWPRITIICGRSPPWWLIHERISGG